MPITITDAIKVITSEPIDVRFVLSKAQMKTANVDLYPEQYFCICSNDNKIYVYAFTNTVDPETGKFRPLEDYLTFDTPGAQQQMETVIENSEVITDINAVLDGDGQNPGLIEQVSDLQEEINNLSMDGGEIE